jgi:hypothetical protein
MLTGISLLLRADRDFRVTIDDGRLWAGEAVGDLEGALTAALMLDEERGLSRLGTS